MSVSFRRFPSTDNCYICQNTMRRSDSVAHAGGGQFHPLHRKCLKVWLQYNDKCPICRIQVDLNSVFTYKDKAVKELKLIGKDALNGGIVATGIIFPVDLLWTDHKSLPLVEAVITIAAASVIGMSLSTGGIQAALAPIVGILRRREGEEILFLIRLRPVC